MSTQEDEFLGRLRATFRVEAAEHLQTIATGLFALEGGAAPAVRGDLVGTVFRAAHSLKGAARAVDFVDVESLCQSLEDLFASWRRQEVVAAPAAFDRAHRALDAIAGALAAPERPGGGGRCVADAREVQPCRPPGTACPAGPAADAVAAVTRAVADVPLPAPVTEQKVPAAEGTVRISVAKLEACLVDAEEMLAAKLSTGQRAAEMRELARPFAAWRHEWQRVEPDVQALRQAVGRPPPGPPPDPGLARLLCFLDANLDYLTSLESRVAALTHTVEQDPLAIGTLVDDLLEDSKRLLLLPFGTLTTSFPKLVHDLCRDLGKEAELVLRGEEIELDKRILEEMKDPLIHLLRNCVDHGIEAPELRTRLGKAARGTITLTVSRLNGSRAEILVSDDGAGVDLGEIKESAVRHGLLAADAAPGLGDDAARDLIFLAEVSTRPLVTRLSGRGLGLAIVREKTEKLGGAVRVESRPGQGTSFCLELPSLLATFRGVLIEAAGQVLVVPTVQVERVVAVGVGDVQTVAGRATIALGGRAVALAWLADILGLPRGAVDAAAAAAVPALVLGQGDLGVAFVVDAVLGEQEVLARPLRKPLSRVRNIAAASVLGSGRLAPILNVADLLKSVRRGVGGSAPAAALAKPAVRAKSVLLVDDSITSRTLLRGILESAGYRVKTAVDGLEAFALARAETFDLVVSDVEMPRLSGFDLTARIRADKKLAELPVVLVTALESREDRERGIDAGADAYLSKSGFDQNNLLDAVRRLA